MDEVTESKFRVGDVVQLPSGGPSMTVNAVRLHQREWQCECTWFDSREVKKSQFAAEALVEYRP